MVQICLDQWVYWCCFSYLSWFFFCCCSKMLAAGWCIKKGFFHLLVLEAEESKGTHGSTAPVSWKNSKCQPVLERGGQVHHPDNQSIRTRTELVGELHSRTQMPPEHPLSQYRDNGEDHSKQVLFGELSPESYSCASSSWVTLCWVHPRLRVKIFLPLDC